MTSDSHSEPNYMGVFWWLLFLTILEIIIAVIPNGPLFSNLLQGFLLITTAVAKAALVALYFMHLKYEKRILGAIAFSPLILMAIALTLLLSDIRIPEPKADEMSSSTVESMMEE